VNPEPLAGAPGARRASTLLRRVITLFSVGMLGQIAGIAAGIVQAHALGPSGKAVIAYAVIALSLVLVGSDGLCGAVLMQAGRDKSQLRRIYAAMLVVVVSVGVPCMIVALGLGIALPSQRPLIGAALAIPFGLYAQGARGILLATGATSTVAWQGSITTVFLNLAIIAALVFGHLASYAILTMWVVGQAAAAGYTALALRRRLVASPRAAKAPPSVGELVREQFRFGTRTSLATVAGYINMRIDVFLISAMLGSKMLGIYTLAVTTGEMLWSVSLPIVYAALENIAGDSFTNSAALTARLMRSVVALQVTLGAALFIAGPWLIDVVYGPAFAPAGPVLRVLLPGLVVYAVEMFLGYFILVQARRPLLIFAVQMVSALACAVITVLTLPRFGIISAALATTVTYLGVVAFKSLYFKRKTGIGLRQQWILRVDDVRPLAAKMRVKLGLAAPAL
jgi:O-antigen/teichoic acid export membrane protein